jgi:translation initiation factor 1A
MVKNTKGGKAFKKSKHNQEDTNKKVELKSENQEYAQVDKLLGNCRLSVNCIDGKVRLGKIRGSIQKRCWISSGDVVLVALREFEDGKCDVIHKYSADHVKKLVKLGEIPESMKSADKVAEHDENNTKDIVDFQEEDDEEEGDKEVDFDLI